jgi:hypothetical protein
MLDNDVRFAVSMAVIVKKPSSEMLRHVALVRTNVSEERITSIIRVTRINELGTPSAVTSVIQLLDTVSTVPSLPILVTLMMEAVHSSETRVLTIVTWHNITEDSIFHF